MYDWDEAIYAQVAKAMNATGDWLRSQYEYQVWIDKPPLLMWSAARLPTTVKRLVVVGNERDGGNSTQCTCPAGRRSTGMLTVKPADRRREEARQ